MKFLLHLCLTLLFLPLCVSSKEEKLLLFEGESDGGELKKKLLSNAGNFKSTDIGDDEDDEYGSGKRSQSSGEGSGELEGSGFGISTTTSTAFTTKANHKPETTSKEKTNKDITPSVIDITLVSKGKDTTTTTEGKNCVDCDTEKPIGPIETESEDDNKNEIVGSKSKYESDKKESGVNFTVGIIIGVVVGAVLAILIIVFLVYRLRKKDEGSYSLDEQSSTAYLRGDGETPNGGKEYFA